jgi:hypothetical protein
MATSTFGSTAQTSLTALINSGSMNATDLAAIVLAIKDDLNVAHPIAPGSYSSMDLLYVPNRGILKVLPGDWVAVDNQGWPILVSANSIANSTWIHSP